MNVLNKNLNSPSYTVNSINSPREESPSGFPSTNAHKYLKDGRKRHTELHLLAEVTSGSNTSSSSLRSNIWEVKREAPAWPMLQFRVEWCSRLLRQCKTREGSENNTVNKHWKRWGGRKHLYERQHFVLHDGGRVGFGGDDFDKNPIDEISVGHVDVKPVSAVFHTRLQYLQKGRGLHWGAQPRNNGRKGSVTPAFYVLFCDLKLVREIRRGVLSLC